MPRLQIDVARRERANNDPLVLVMNGEEYACQDDISEFVLMEMAASGSTSDFEETATAFMGFLADVIAPEDLARFKAQARREKWDVDQMLPLVQGAVEYYSARPTGPLSSSPTGPETTTTPSKVVDLHSGKVTEAAS